MNAPESASTAEPVLLTRAAGGVVHLTLNRPQQFNALSEQMLAALQAALDRIEADTSARVVVIAGAGRAFCAGHDLKQMRANPQLDYYQRLFADCARMMRRIQTLPQPVIARINGWVFGGGFTVVTGCDIAIAADDVQFGLSEVNFGHFPGGEVTIVLTEHLQPKHGLYYALTGKTMNAKEAERIGLITKAVPRADLDKEVMEIANNLKEKAPSALNAVKEAWYYTFYSNPDVAYELSNLISDKAKQAIGGRPGLQQFARKEYRPGLGSYKFEEKK